MADELEIVFIIFRVLPILFHSFGIYLLLTVNYMKRYQRIQGRYLFWLSTIEILLNASKIVIKLTEKDVAFYLDIVRTGFLSTQILLILITMTIDRAAFVWLSLKYKMKKANRVTNLVFIGNIVISISVTLILYFTQESNKELSENKALFYWPIMNGLVLINFLCCYLFMLRTIANRSQNLYGAEAYFFSLDGRKYL